MKKDCQEFQQELSAYLDDQLAPEVKSELEAHLRLCPSCQQELELFRATVQAVQTLPTPQAPQDFLIKLRRRIEEQAEYQPVSFWNRITTKLVAHPSLLAITMVMLFIGAFSLGRFSPQFNFKPVSHELEPAFAWKGTAVNYGWEQVSAPQPEGASPVMAVSYSALGSPEQKARRERFILQTPTQLIITLINQDRSFKEAEVYPISQGAVIITKEKVLRVTISNPDFLKALKQIAQTGLLPTSLSEAKEKFSLKIEELPNPLKPLP